MPTPLSELHIHLEGAFPREMLESLIVKYDDVTREAAAKTLMKRLEFTSFADFTDAWTWKNQYVRSIDDIVEIAAALAEDRVSSGIEYTELFISPSDFEHVCKRPGDYVRAILRGIARHPEVSVNLVIDLVRDYGPENAKRTFHDIAAAGLERVVGIGLGGGEESHSAKAFREIFQEAKRYGLHRSVHAGESSGPRTIWEALEHLEPERIGHGTSAIEDDQLIEQLVKLDIPLEVCPTSNVRTCGVNSLREHPVAEFYSRGVPIVIGTDDPLMFECTLEGEYSLLQTECGLNEEDIETLKRNAIGRAWRSEL